VRDNAPYSSRARSGFSLVELIVSLALIDALLVALLATNAYVTRELGMAAGRTSALAAAHARIERLASLSCGPPRSGEAMLGPSMREWWFDSPASGVTRVLSDSIALITQRGRVAVVLRGRRSC
jgi:type II secretory pathway pseudopilin PulG